MGRAVHTAPVLATQRSAFPCVWVERSHRNPRPCHSQPFQLVVDPVEHRGDTLARDLIQRFAQRKVTGEKENAQSSDLEHCERIV